MDQCSNLLQMVQRREGQLALGRDRMENTQATKSATVAVPRRGAIQQGQETILGEIPRLNVTSKPKEKTRKPPFGKGDLVYFTAYLKKNPGAFYMCQGVVDRMPEQGVRKYWKVKVIAVGDRPVGGKPLIDQTTLLGMTLSKKTRELSKVLAPFMQPPDWIMFKK